jgi:predicted nuclease of predicted toxin-antitoxin system
LKFLVDESTGIGVSNNLKEMGYDSVSVIEFMKGAEDVDIVETAKREDRIILTNDKDFGWLAAVYKPPGLILLRLKKETLDNKMRVIKDILSKHQGSILGNMIVATEKKIRIRPLSVTHR